MLLALSALLVLAAAAAGFLAGIKHADKANAVKDILKK